MQQKTNKLLHCSQLTYKEAEFCVISINSFLKYNRYYHTIPRIKRWFLAETFDKCCLFCIG